MTKKYPEMSATKKKELSILIERYELRDEMEMSATGALSINNVAIPYVLLKLLKKLDAQELRLKELEHAAEHHKRDAYENRLRREGMTDALRALGLSVRPTQGYHPFNPHPPFGG